MVSSQHEEVRADMQGLASGIEELHHTRVGDMEMKAQVQATLQWTLSASSSLEMRVGQIEEQQMQAHVTAEEAKQASQRALLQAQKLQKEQERTSQ